MRLRWSFVFFFLGLVPSPGRLSFRPRVSFFGVVDPPVPSRLVERGSKHTTPMAGCSCCTLALPQQRLNQQPPALLVSYATSIEPCPQAPIKKMIDIELKSKSDTVTRPIRGVVEDRAEDRKWWRNRPDKSGGPKMRACRGSSRRIIVGRAESYPALTTRGCGGWHMHERLGIDRQGAVVCSTAPSVGGLWPRLPAVSALRRVFVGSRVPSRGRGAKHLDTCRRPPIHIC